MMAKVLETLVKEEFQEFLESNKVVPFGFRARLNKQASCRPWRRWRWLCSTWRKLVTGSGEQVVNRRVPHEMVNQLALG